MGRGTLILDSGALSAFAEGKASVRSYVRDALKAGREVAIPSVVVAETTRGTPRDATVNRAINLSVVIPLDITLARAA